VQVEGITWHAVTLEVDEVAATKKLLIEVFGLTPAIDTDGWTMFPMSNGTILASSHQEPSLPTASTKASCSASGSTTSKPPPPNSRQRDASSWARSLASGR
jgi:hypothetical protein